MGAYVWVLPRQGRQIMPPFFCSISCKGCSASPPPPALSSA
nr:MAG TPA: PLATZ transcription factor [Caudoviricetes sp.]